MIISRHHSRKLAYSPPYIFVFRGYLAMLEAKLTHPALKFTNTSEVVWLLDDETNRVVAATLFVVDTLGCVFTQFTFVDPEFRGNGLSIQLYNWLEEVVKHRLGVELKAIYTDTVEENGVMRKTLERTGREAYTVRTAKFFNGAGL